MKCLNGNSLDLLKIYFERFKKRQFVGQSKKSSKGLKSFLRFVNDHVLIFNETHWDGALWRAGFMEKFPVPLHFSQFYTKISQDKCSKGKGCINQATRQN